MVKTNRKERQELAEQIIKSHPNWNRDRINASLRSQIGTGLRKQVVDDIRNKVLSRTARTPMAIARAKALSLITKRTKASRRRLKRAVSWYDDLLQSGFTRIEARVLQNVPSNVPYMQALFNDRMREYQQALSEGITKNEWRRQINAMYTEKGWTKLGLPDPWMLLREYEDRYKDKYPEYETPEKKRKRKISKDFVSKYEKGLEAYDRGRGR